MLGCFLDASKAFDLVNHGVLFCKLFDRGLPLSVLRFLSSWYETQKMSVRWSHSFSDPFSVSNGVRQGSVLSPVLFSVYLDELLEMLGNSGVGCHWGGSFVGALCYADDIVLLAPCASALRHMLNICDSFATSHGLVFNAQLICFRRCHTLSNIPTISFNDITLPFLKEVTHLGHILTYNLDDKPDIIRAVKDMNRKANSVLCRFSALDPFIKCFLIKTYCLSLYGCSLWSLSSPSIRIIEVAFNKLLRKIWNLPYNSHTGIVHCTAKIHSVSNMLYDRFCSLHSFALSSSSSLIQSIFVSSTQHIYSFTGYNYIHGYTHYRHYYFEEFHAAFIIRCLRSTYGIHSPCENIVQFVSCS